MAGDSWDNSWLWGTAESHFVSPLCLMNPWYISHTLLPFFFPKEENIKFQGCCSHPLQECSGAYKHPQENLHISFVWRKPWRPAFHCCTAMVVAYPYKQGEHTNKGCLNLKHTLKKIFLPSDRSIQQQQPGYKFWSQVWVCPVQINLCLCLFCWPSFFQSLDLPPPSTSSFVSHLPSQTNNHRSKH